MFLCKKPGQAEKTLVNIAKTGVICPTRGVGHGGTRGTRFERAFVTNCPATVYRHQQKRAVPQGIMRKTITISVSEEMHTLIHKGMRTRYYSTVSEYIRFLVRRDQARDAVTRQDPPVRLRTANQAMEDVPRESKF